MDIDVAFTWEYSKVSISSGNEKYSSPKMIRLSESVDKRVTTKRREMNDRRVERVLDMGLRVSQLIKRLRYYLH
jgi:hypothetical protein